MPEPSPVLTGYRFGVFEVELRAGEIRKNGLRIKLQEQPFQVLTLLLQHSPNLVAREDLRKQLWDEDTFVEFDHGLSNAISRIREALGDSADNPRFIETLPKRGYRFILPIEEVVTIPVSATPGNGSRSEARPPETERHHARADEAAPTIGTMEVGTIPQEKKQKVWVRPPLLALAGFLAIAVIALLTGFLIRATRSPTQAVTRLAMTLPPADQLDSAGIALSPDGSRLVYVAKHGDADYRLYVRSTASFEASPIPGTENASYPFFSPDGKSVGFSAEEKLKKVSLDGGTPLTLCSAPGMRGATWDPDGTIIFAPSTGAGLYRVSAGGGTPTPLAIPDPKKGEVSYRWPQVLPGGKAVLFTIWGGADRRIGLLSLETGERRVLVDGGTFPRYVPSGHLIYAREGGLLAVPFDLSRLAVTGPPVSVLEGVDMSPVNGEVEFSFSANGSLAYIPGVSGVGDRTLLWVNRKGVAQVLPAPPRGYQGVRLSPDGQRIAVGIVDTNPGMWIYELARGTLTRLTSSTLNPYQIWTPDGRRLTFRSGQSTPFSLDSIPADGSGSAERLTIGEGLLIPTSWSPDGHVLSFSGQNPTTGWDIWMLKLEGGDRKPHLFLQTAANEDGAIFSPDGRWLAYQSNETGRYEVFVRPFPGPGGKSQISTDGGTEPLWARNGRELFYRNGDKMMAASVQTKPMFAAAKPNLLFTGNYAAGVFGFRPNYDVSPDSQRFLMVKEAVRAQSASQINFVLNWFEDLKRRVPSEEK